MSTKNFNSYCLRDGVEFENAVIAHEILQNKSTIVSRNQPIPGAGIVMDVVVDSPLRDGKGAYTPTIRKYLQVKGGKPGISSRPGARRTDNVKKAIADGLLLKSSVPDSWYVVYFSERPSAGSSSDAMINAAVNSGVIDEVQYLSYSGEVA
jgi:hypothetical protein